jgi:hypothetical protein
MKTVRDCNPTKHIRYYRLPLLFCDQRHVTICIRIYGDLCSFRKAVRYSEAWGLFRRYAKPQKYGAECCIYLPADASITAAVHESFHAARYAARYMDWNQTDDEEEEFLTDAVASISSAVLDVLLTSKHCSKCCL